MPIDREELEAAARSLKVVLFGEHRYDLGYIGVGVSDIHVYVHSGMQSWNKKHVHSWEGFSVTWHFNVGKAVAYLAP